LKWAIRNLHNNSKILKSLRRIDSINSNSTKAILQEELNQDGDFLKEMVRSIMQEVMEEERDTQVGVLSHKRDNTKRKANRNGTNPLF
jgi:transposase-like protein